MPAFASTSFTSSSLNGLMIASMRFIALLSVAAAGPIGGRGQQRQCHSTRGWSAVRATGGGAIGGARAARGLPPRPLRVRAYALGGAARSLRSRDPTLLDVLVDPDQSESNRVPGEPDPIPHVELPEDVVDVR